MKPTDWIVGVSVVVIIAGATVGIHQRRERETTEPDVADVAAEPATTTPEAKPAAAAPPQNQAIEVESRAEPSPRPAFERSLAQQPRPQQRGSTVSRGGAERVNADTWDSARSVAGGESIENMRARRERCRADLTRAETEKTRLKTEFDRGVASIATVDTLTPQVEGIPKGTLRSEMGVDRNGMLPDGSPAVVTGGGGASVDVHGQPTPCREVLRNRGANPGTAAQCDALQEKIDRAEEDAKRAMDCLRRR